MKSPDMTQTNKVAMSRVKRPLENQNLKGKQKGLTMVEYAIAGTLVTVAAAGAFTLLGAEIATAIGTLITNMGGTAP